MPTGTVAPAGMIDVQFGRQSVRQLPPLMAAEITSTYSCETGYSWRELRGAPGVGQSPMSIAPLEGNLAYDLSGSTQYQPGTRVLMSIDRDQTIYWIQLVFLFEPCCGSGSGSGSGSEGSGGSGSCGGSGSGCDTGFTTVSVANVGGISTLTAKSVKIGLDGNRLTLLECSSESFDLGPGGVDPGGVTLPVVTNVCPVFTTIQYLDWNSDPQSIDVVTGITVERRLITVPVAEENKSCVTSDSCCGSGSGSGSGDVPCDETTDPCISSCGQCDPMSAQWTFAFGELTVAVCNLGNPNNGNPCRFVSGDLNWQLSYDSASGLWILENFATGAFYYIPGSAWSCDGPNEMADLMDGPAITISPVHLCSVTPTTCPQCPGGSAAPFMNFSLTGITDVGCSAANCASTYNNTFKLGFSPTLFFGSCAWGSDQPGGSGRFTTCSGLDTAMTLFKSGSDWTLFMGNAEMPSYTFSGSWDCVSPITLTRGADANACSGSPCCAGWPATIIATPSS